MRKLSYPKWVRVRDRKNVEEQLRRAEVRPGDNYALASLLKRLIDLNDQHGDPLDLHPPPPGPSWWRTRISEELDDEPEAPERTAAENKKYWDNIGDEFWERYGPKPIADE